MAEDSKRGELVDKVVKIRRCAAVVKGGRRFSFTALVVVGDGQGKVGWGYGKANEVPPAVEKAVTQGRTVGQGGFDDLNGFLQIDFNVAPGIGESAHMAWEEKARIYFHPGRAFAYEGHSVLVTACGMSQGRHVENFYRKSLTVAFRGHLKRNEVI